jgi:hypothetical protein
MRQSLASCNSPYDFRLWIADASALEGNSAAAFVLFELFDDWTFSERGLASVIRHGRLVALRLGVLVK